MKKEESILLIWDIDGTILTCGGSGKEAMNRTFYSLFGIEEAFESINMAGRVDRSILKEVFKRNRIDDCDVEAFYTLYAKNLDLILEDPGKLKILDGVNHILDYTSKSEKYYNVIGTGNCETGAWLKLKHTKLDRYFHTGGFGSYDFERVNVVRNAVKRAREFYLKPFDNNAKIFIIGDTPADIECGQQMNVKTIAVATGGYTVEHLKTYRPDYLLNSLNDPSLFYEIFEMI